MAVEWRGQRGGCGHVCLRLCATALCLFVILPAFSVLDAANKAEQSDERSVKLLMVELTDLSLATPLVGAFFAGLDASLWYRNHTVANGVRVEIIQNTTVTNNYATLLKKEISKKKDDIFVLVGHFGGFELEQIMPTLEAEKVVAFSPFTGSSAVRKWNPNVYFLRPDPAAELLALIRYAFYDLRVHRLGFMYLQGVSFGEAEYEHAQRVVSEMGYELCGVFTVKSSLTHASDDAVFDAAWKQFVARQPQAVILYGPTAKDTEKFIRRMLEDPLTADVYLLTISSIKDHLMGVWRNVFSGVAGKHPDKIITTGANPLATDTSSEAVRRFQEMLRDYLRNHNSTLQKVVGYDFGNDENQADIMFYGWLVGEVLLQALGSREWLTNRTAFQRSLFNQRRYVVDDLVFGDYGDECSAAAAANGATCRCNQGGRTVYVKRFVGGSRAEGLQSGRMTLRAGDCDASSLSLLPVASMVGVSLVDKQLAKTAFFFLRFGVFAALNVIAGKGMQDSFTMAYLPCTMDNATDALLAEMAERRVHAVVGVVTEAVLDVPGVTFIDPLLLEPRLSRYRKCVIYLSPTLEQQFFVLAQHLGNTSGASAHVVVRGGDGAAVADVLLRSLATFGGSLLSTTLLAGDDALEGRLPRGGNVFVVGLGAGDADVVARHVAAHSGVRVLVAFSDLAVLYAEFVSAFDRGDGADRVVFATSLPHWNDPKTTSVSARKFNAALPDTKHRTPLSMLAFLHTMLLQTVLSRMDRVGGGLLADFFYKNVAISVDDMVYGSFADDSACFTGGTRCAVNYGATSIAVWSLSRSVNPSVPPLAAPVTPSMDYRDPNAGRLTRAQLIGIIAGCVLAAALLAAVVAMLLWYCRDSRDNRNAPREQAAPVTLVFTDIESSTALWAACPKEMPDAVAAHHRLIRSLIMKYGCYEVKTIGDSFMIACQSVFAAVQLVRELQQEFVQHDWESVIFDETYRAFEERRAVEEMEEGGREYVPPTARLDADVYRQYWNGLRVRVGVHTGLCDIRHDPVTKGYDYYGDTSNTAARTESIANGGQVLLTRAAYMALSTAERAQLNVTPLGAVALRGVPRPVEMYQLNAVPGRTFAALRLKREANDLEVCNGDFSCSSLTNTDVSIAYDNPFFGMISDLLDPLSLPQRQRVLQSLCDRWDVPVFFKKWDNISNACTYAISRLAVKLTRVAARKVELLGEEQNTGLFTLLGSTSVIEVPRSSVGSVLLDINVPRHQRNRIVNHHLSRSGPNNGSTTTIICRPPPGISLS